MFYERVLGDGAIQLNYERKQITSWRIKSATAM